VSAYYWVWTKKISMQVVGRPVHVLQILQLICFWDTSCGIKNIYSSNIYLSLLPAPCHVPFGGLMSLTSGWGATRPRQERYISMYDGACSSDRKWGSSERYVSACRVWPSYISETLLLSLVSQKEGAKIKKERSSLPPHPRVRLVLFGPI
jgi:hypothetical protein